MRTSGGQGRLRLFQRWGEGMQVPAAREGRRVSAVTANPSRARSLPEDWRVGCAQLWPRRGSIPQVRGLHLHGCARLFTAGVRPVIAGMENSFLSPAFIYTLIRETSFTSEWQRVAAPSLAPGQPADLERLRQGCPRQRPSVQSAGWARG